MFIFTTPLIFVRIFIMQIDQNSLDSESSWVPDTLAQTSVAIWGMGLMGGSLALALRGKTSALFGIDPDEKTCQQAKEMSLFTRVSTNPTELLPKANLIILCAPLGLIPALLKQIPLDHPGHAVIMDIGSTKNNILPIMEGLPDRFIPIGGHPMSGKEVSSLSNATADLYQGGSFALLALPRTTKAASQLVLQLIEAIGAHPVWLDPLEHDRWAAAISALPYLVANCLSGVTPLEAAPLVGPGYKSTTRLATENIDMMHYILANNRENVLTDLKQFHARLELIENALEQNDFETLTSLFEEGAARRSATMNSFLQGGKS
jgi:prephenate dehydrogenase